MSVLDVVCALNPSSDVRTAFGSVARAMGYDKRQARGLSERSKDAVRAHKSAIDVTLADIRQLPVTEVLKMVGPKGNVQAVFWTTMALVYPHSDLRPVFA